MQNGPLSLSKQVHVVDAESTETDSGSPLRNGNTDEGATDRIVSEADIMNAHLHLGHAETPTLMRIFKLAGKNVTPDMIERALCQCKCDRIGGYPQNPTASKYLPDAPGQTISHGYFLSRNDELGTGIVNRVCIYQICLCSLREFTETLIPYSNTPEQLGLFTRDTCFHSL